MILLNLWNAFLLSCTCWIVAHGVCPHLLREGLLEYTMCCHSFEAV